MRSWLARRWRVGAARLLGLLLLLAAQGLGTVDASAFGILPGPGSGPGQPGPPHKPPPTPRPPPTFQPPPTFRPPPPTLLPPLPVVPRFPVVTPAPTPTPHPVVPTSISIGLPGPARAGSGMAISATLTAKGGGGLAARPLHLLIDGTQEATVLTNSAGGAGFKVARTLSPGNHGVVVSYAGDPAGGEQPSSASGSFVVLPPLPTSVSLGLPGTPVKTGQQIAVYGRLTASSGPLVKAALHLYIDGNKRITLQTAGDGSVRWKLPRHTPAGTHTVTLQYHGDRRTGIAPASASGTLVILPLEVSLQATPALPGIDLNVDGADHVTDAQGRVALELATIGAHQVSVTPPADTASTRVRFAKWYDGDPSPTKQLRVFADETVYLAFTTAYLTPVSFADGDGRPVDVSRISGVRIAGPQSVTTPVDTGQHDLWLTVPAPSRAQLIGVSPPPRFALEAARYAGVSVANHGDDAFIPGPGRSWRIDLRLYTLRVAMRQPLIGSGYRAALVAGGSARPIAARADQAGEVVLPDLPRGLYTVRPAGHALGPALQVQLTRDQEVDVPVYTPPEVILAGLLLLLGVAGAVGAAVAVQRRPPAAASPPEPSARRVPKRRVAAPVPGRAAGLATARLSDLWWTPSRPGPAGGPGYRLATFAGLSPVAVEAAADRHIAQAAGEGLAGLLVAWTGGRPPQEGSAAGDRRLELVVERVAAHNARHRPALGLALAYAPAGGGRRSPASVIAELRAFARSHGSGTAFRNPYSARPLVLWLDSGRFAPEVVAAVARAVAASVCLLADETFLAWSRHGQLLNGCGWSDGAGSLWTPGGNRTAPAGGRPAAGSQPRFWLRVPGGEPVPYAELAQPQAVLPGADAPVPVASDWGALGPTREAGDLLRLAGRLRQPRPPAPADRRWGGRPDPLAAVVLGDGRRRAGPGNGSGNRAAAPAWRRRWRRSPGPPDAPSAPPADAPVEVTAGGLLLGTLQGAGGPGHPLVLIDAGRVEGALREPVAR